MGDILDLSDVLLDELEAMFFCQTLPMAQCIVYKSRGSQPIELEMEPVCRVVCHIEMQAEIVRLISAISQRRMVRDLQGSLTPIGFLERVEVDNGTVGHWQDETALAILLELSTGTA